MLATWLRLLPMTLARVLLRVAEAVHQLPIALRLLDGVEVLALDVLDDGDLEHFLVGQRAHDDRHVMQIGLLRRAPAALAGDDLVGVAQGRTDHDRLHQPFSRIESASSSSWPSAKSRRGLNRPGFSAASGTLRCVLVGAPRLLRAIADQRRKPASQPRLLRAYGHGEPPPRKTVQASRRTHPPLALDHLGGELNVGLAAGAAIIVEQHRLAVRRRLGHPHIARDDGLVDLLAENARTSSAT